MPHVMNLVAAKCEGFRSCGVLGKISSALAEKTLHDEIVIVGNCISHDFVLGQSLFHRFVVVIDLSAWKVVICDTRLGKVPAIFHGNCSGVKSMAIELKIE